MKNGKGATKFWKAENFKSLFSRIRFSASLSGSVFLFCLIFFTSCSELQKPKTEPFYSQKPTTPPARQEFRWSNGKMPKSFDPSQASASPEIDFVRALYEGLTDIDSKTLEPVPAIALKWSASEDFKTWTFYLRKDAQWSNGEIVDARDFVNSWKRLAELGDKVPQRQLLKNIVGMDTENVLPIFADEEIDIPSKTGNESKTANENKTAGEKKQNESNSKVTEQKTETQANSNTKVNAAPKKAEKQIREIRKDNFGVEAVNDFTLKVSLTQPDKDFPSLVAHPVFRPIYEDDEDIEGLDKDIVTNGAFQIVSIADDGIVLKRADYYWNASKIQLEQVRFVPTENAESALAEYRAGNLDAVTNADFKPLALKLLAPYGDFRQTTHSALNFYEFNPVKTQFADPRIRKALAMAIERERLTDDEMDGASFPARRFLPGTDSNNISQDAAKAQSLLADAGFANGKDFPAIKLLINRNDMQRRIARSVAKMWKKNLNVDTEIVVKDGPDFEAAVQNGEFDIVRRGMVLPTTDETANMLAMFPLVPQSKAETVKLPDNTHASNNSNISHETTESNTNTSPNANVAEKKTATPPLPDEKPSLVLTEKQALDTLPAIPLYFPASYSLVKPYVQGFESNILDAPSLKNVKIDNDWQPSNQKILSNDNN